MSPIPKLADERRREPDGALLGHVADHVVGQYCRAEDQRHVLLSHFRMYKPLLLQEYFPEREGLLGTMDGIYAEEVESLLLDGGWSGIHDELVIVYADRPVLITGGASFIGSHLAEMLVRSGARVTVTDDLSENLDAAKSRISFLAGDLREAEFSAAATARQSVVFHLAASYGGRGYIDTHPVECTNNMLLHTVFTAAAAGAENIDFGSPASVYPTDL